MISHDKIKKDFTRNAYFFKRSFFLWIFISAFGIICSGLDLSAGEKVAYDAHGRRDPFVPLVTLSSKASTGLAGVESVEDVAVEGLVYDPKHGSVAVVNGSVMKEGEELGNVKVLEIKADGVWFLLNGMRVFKRMHQE